MHFRPVAPSLLKEETLMTSSDNDLIVVFMLAGMRHRGREGVFVSAGVRVSKLRGGVAFYPSSICVSADSQQTLASRHTPDWV